MEIYNERINDLLDPSQNNLKIREGARGVWIQGISTLFSRYMAMWYRNHSWVDNQAHA